MEAHRLQARRFGIDLHPGQIGAELNPCNLLLSVTWIPAPIPSAGSWQRVENLIDALPDLPRSRNYPLGSHSLPL